jgi:hypothetical protein
VERRLTTSAGKQLLLGVVVIYKPVHFHGVTDVAISFLNVSSTQSYTHHAQLLVDSAVNLILGEWSTPHESVLSLQPLP